MHQFLLVFQEYLVTATITLFLTTGESTLQLWFFILFVLKAAK